MWIKKLLVAGAALAGMMLGTGEAKADYVCSVRYYPGSVSLGSEGYITLATTAAPDCVGAVRTVYYCTTGAGSTACAASPNDRYERQGILALFQALQRASSVDQRIDVTTVACNLIGSTVCGSTVTFRGD